MSKTIEEIIEEYTKYRISGVANFNEMISKSLIQPKYHVKKIAERYAQSQTQELIEQKRELVDMLVRCEKVISELGIATDDIIELIDKHKQS